MLTLDMTTPKDPGEAFPNDAARWAAVRSRDRTADGVFVYGVRTTGVYCRPSCAARLPLRQNVSFHASGADAERAGLRPCKRCRPGETGDRLAEVVSQACRTIEQADESPSLDDLAAAAGMSRFHFHRVFKAVTGITPKAYGDARRGERVRGQLQRGEAVTTALYEAGFSSGGRFYAQAPTLLGMTPTAYRGGGKGATMRFAVGQCWLGAILVAATDRGVSAIEFGDDAEVLVRGLQDRFPHATLVGDDADFARLVATAVAMVETPDRSVDLPLDVRGTAFQQRVWQAITEIPPGKTATYSQIAEAIGRPGAVRAVARACATNEIAVAIPCHRVVRTDGSPSGYRWGLERKAKLLAREAE